MPTLKDCYICSKKIGVASKTCKHCSAEQPYKQKLEKKKKQLSQEWKDRQKKNSSVNKVYDATNLLLHKWEILERFPILLLARKTSNGFSAECFCPWKMDTEDTQDAFHTIKRLYESLLNVAIADKEASMGESSAINVSQTESPPADPVSESTPLLTCNVAIADKEASSMGESSAINVSQTETPPADPVSESTPLLTSESDTLLLHPASSSLASPMSLSIAPPVSPLTHPVFISSQSSPLSSSLASPLPPASTLSTCSKLSTELGNPGPVSSSRKKRHIKRKADHKECPMHKESTNFPYKKILRKRIREGHAEVLVQWHPCSGCGKKWKNSWEPRENIQSSS